MAGGSTAPFTGDIGAGGSFIAQPSPPADTDVLWIDTSENDPVATYHDGSSWVPISAGAFTGIEEVTTFTESGVTIIGNADAENGNLRPAPTQYSVSPTMSQSTTADTGGAWETVVEFELTEPGLSNIEAYIPNGADDGWDFRLEDSGGTTITGSYNAQSGGWITFDTGGSLDSGTYSITASSTSSLAYYFTSNNTGDTKKNGAFQYHGASEFTSTLTGEASHITTLRIDMRPDTATASVELPNPDGNSSWDTFAYSTIGNVSVGLEYYDAGWNTLTTSLSSGDDISGAGGNPIRATVDLNTRQSSVEALIGRFVYV